MTVYAALAVAASSLLSAWPSGVAQAAPSANYCSSYARIAVNQHSAAIARGCRVGGARWHDNHTVHFSWCRRQTSTTNPAGEINFRRGYIGRSCPPPPTFCREYASAAVRQYRVAAGRGCRVGGARWHGNHAVHFNWCRRQTGTGTPIGERLWRNRQIAGRRCPR